MKKLTGALVLSLSLLLLSGCRSSGEPRGQEDASTASPSEQPPSPAGAVDTARGALTGGTAGTPSTGTEQPPAGAGSGSDPDPGAATGKGSGEGTPTAQLSEAERLAQESCLDQWLNSKNLDEYGHPEGTMYAGGSPLFNEATGESRDRLEYVYQRHAAAKQACANASKAPAQK